MPYTLTHVTTPLSIAERQWTSAPNVAPANGDPRPTVQFTPFTSCVGIVARNLARTQVIGVHLALYDGGVVFGVRDVATVINALTAASYDPSEVIAFGSIAFWRGSAPAAFEALLAALPGALQYAFGDGTYGAGIDEDGVLVLTY